MAKSKNQVQDDVQSATSKKGIVLCDIFSSNGAFKKGANVELPANIFDAWEEKGIVKEV